MTGGALGKDASCVTPPRGREPTTRGRDFRKKAYALRERAYRAKWTEPFYAGSVDERDRTRELQRERQRGCGRWRCASHVELRRSADHGTASANGVQTCGSVWECPVCAAKIRAERAEELTKAVGDWLAGGGAVYMVTTTVRHSRRDDVQSLTRWLCKAWSATIRGAPWKRWRSRTGTVAYVRAMEVMLMGPSGPHPHLHVLLFTSGPLASFQYQRAVHWLRERWRDSVRKCFPSTDLYNADLDRHGRHWRHEPTLSAGVNVLRVRAGEGASYISKMGCEMSGISKRGKRGAVDPWGVLNRAADGDPVAAVEWCAYSSGVRGMRLHTWSRGGRAALGLVPDVDDEALAEVVTHERVCVLTGDAWDLLARSVGAARVFDAAESSRGRADVLALVATHCGRTVAAECWEATTRAGPDPWDCILLPGVVKCDHESEAPNAR